MKKVSAVISPPAQHWVGDGFPVHSVFSYNAMGQDISPFLLLDHAGPHHFSPAVKPRGVGEHPHRGFETVTIVYDGEVAHRDSTGQGGVIGPGDVQWMTAAGGILHEEFHSPAYTRTGGPFHMAQLWVNLPASAKMSAPGYQGIVASDIPVVDLPGNAGSLRVIAGDAFGKHGPAHTFTPVNVWDLNLNAGAAAELALPEDHTAMMVVLKGKIKLGDSHTATQHDVVMFERVGTAVQIEAVEAAMLLVLTGQPIEEPIAGYGPFVMNNREEIMKAFEDFNGGKFGTMNPGS